MDENVNLHVKLEGDEEAENRLRQLAEAATITPPDSAREQARESLSSAPLHPSVPSIDVSAAKDVADASKRVVESFAAIGDSAKKFSTVFSNLGTIFRGSNFARALGIKPDTPLKDGGTEPRESVARMFSRILGSRVLMKPVNLAFDYAKNPLHDNFTINRTQSATNSAVTTLAATGSPLAAAIAGLTSWLHADVEHQNKLHTQEYGFQQNLLENRRQVESSLGERAFRAMQSMLSRPEQIANLEQRAKMRMGIVPHDASFMPEYMQKGLKDEKAAAPGKRTIAVVNGIDMAAEFYERRKGGPVAYSSAVAEAEALRYFKMFMGFLAPPAPDSVPGDSSPGLRRRSDVKEEGYEDLLKFIYPGFSPDAYKKYGLPSQPSAPNVQVAASPGGVTPSSQGDAASSRDTPPAVSPSAQQAATPFPRDPSPIPPHGAEELAPPFSLAPSPTPLPKETRQDAASHSPLSPASSQTPPSNEMRFPDASHPLATPAEAISAAVAPNAERVVENYRIRILAALPSAPAFSLPSLEYIKNTPSASAESVGQRASAVAKKNEEYWKHVNSPETDVTQLVDEKELFKDGKTYTGHTRGGPATVVRTMNEGLKQIRSILKKPDEAPLTMADITEFFKKSVSPGGVTGPMEFATAIKNQIDSKAPEPLAAFRNNIVSQIKSGEFKDVDLQSLIWIRDNAPDNEKDSEWYKKINQEYIRQDQKMAEDISEATWLKLDPSQVLNQYTEASRTTDTMARQGFFIGSQVDVQDVNKDILQECRKIFARLEPLAHLQIARSESGIMPDSNFQ